MTENKGGIPEQMPQPLTYTIETPEERAERLRDEQGFYGGKFQEFPSIPHTGTSSKNVTHEEYWRRSHDPVIQRDRDKRAPRYSKKQSHK